VVVASAVLLVATGVVTDVVIDHEAAPTTGPTLAPVHLHHSLSARSVGKLVTMPRYVGIAKTRTLVLSHALQLWLPLSIPIQIGTWTPA
jgi:hypothetical protein